MTLLCGISLLFLGSLLVFTRAGKKRFTITLPEKAILYKMVFTFLTLFLYVAMIYFLGYLISTLFCTIVLFRIFSTYPLYKCLLMGIVFTAMLYLIFIFALEMPFPQGELLK